MGRTTTSVFSKDEGDMYWFDGGLVTIKAGAEDTGGNLFFFESWMVKDMSAALHYDEADENWYVIDGEVRMHVDGKEHLLKPGSYLAIPQGVPHGYLVASDTAKVLVAFTPASLPTEAFFRDAGDKATSPTLPPKPDATDVQRIVDAAKRHGLKILGPPPFQEAKSASEDWEG